MAVLEKIEGRGEDYYTQGVTSADNPAKAREISLGVLNDFLGWFWGNIVVDFGNEMILENEYYYDRPDPWHPDEPDRFQVRSCFTPFETITEQLSILYTVRFRTRSTIFAFKTYR
jgi:hypothetical protein